VTDVIDVQNVGKDSVTRIWAASGVMNKKTTRMMYKYLYNYILEETIESREGCDPFCKQNCVGRRDGGPSAIPLATVQYALEPG
jgi:hypothetical protein